MNKHLDEEFDKDIDEKLKHNKAKKKANYQNIRQATQGEQRRTDILDRPGLKSGCFSTKQR
jgi:hypothetical protein